MRHLCHSSSGHMLSCLKSIKKLEMKSGVHVLCPSSNLLYLQVQRLLMVIITMSLKEDYSTPTKGDAALEGSEGYCKGCDDKERK